MNLKKGCDLMYKIGELSKLCKLPVKTLRYYDSVGLLVPDEIDRFTGYRYYSASRLSDCNRIVALKELGFSLDEIRRHLFADSTESVVLLLDAKAAELKSLISTTESQIKRLEAVKQIIAEGKKIMFDVIIRSADTVHVAYVRSIFSTKADAFLKAEEMKNTLPKHIIGTRVLIINYETEYRESDFDLAVCVEINSTLPSGCVYAENTITIDGEIASLVCKRDELDAAYRFMSKQLDEQNTQVVGAYYEFYHDDETVELKVPIYRSSSTDLLQEDNSELPFVNDEEVLGKWKLLDIVPSEEQFLYGHEKCKHSGWLDELYFLENGEKYWALGGWTKGFLVTESKHRFNNAYTIKNQNGHTLLFLEMKHFSDGGAEKLAAPEIWVYEKEDSKIYHSADIKRCDFVDYPFVPDESIIGEWKVRDFYGYDFEHKFDPAKQNWKPDDLFVKGLKFYHDGSAERLQKSGNVKLNWTRGLVLEKREKIASAYEIRTCNGVDCLIVEWKSGDYVFGSDAKICHYTFVRA